MKLIYLLASCFECGKTCRRLQRTRPFCDECRRKLDADEPAKEGGR